jgi:hypothetical protein
MNAQKKSDSKDTKKFAFTLMLHVCTCICEQNDNNKKVYIPMVYYGLEEMDVCIHSSTLSDRLTLIICSCYQEKQKSERERVFLFVFPLSSIIIRSTCLNPVFSKSCRKVFHGENQFLRGSTATTTTTTTTTATHSTCHTCGLSTKCTLLT